MLHVFSVFATWDVKLGEHYNLLYNLYHLKDSFCHQCGIKQAGTQVNHTMDKIVT